MTINIARVLSFVFLLNIFRLYPSFLPGSIGIFFGGRIIDILVVSILFTLMLLKSSKIKFEDFSMFLGMPIFIISIFYGISLFSGISMGYSFSTFSMVEFFRYTLTGVIGLAFLTFGNHIKDSFINKFWIYAIVLNLLFNVCLLFLPGFQSFADILISSKTKLSVLDPGLSSSSYILRSSGLFINPNWAGLFYNIALVYFLFSSKDILQMNNWGRSILILFTLICIFMTGSRTAIVLFLAVISIYFFLRFKIMSIIFITFFYFIIETIALDPSSWTFLPVHYRSLLSAIFIYGDLSTIASFDDRLELWKSIFENYILLRPSLGFGVTDSIGIADNQYLWMLASYGYIGTSIIFFYLISLLSIMFFIPNTKPSNTFYRRFTYISFTLFLIAGLTGQFLNVTQLFFLWFMIFGIYLSRTRIDERDIK